MCDQITSKVITDAAMVLKGASTQEDDQALRRQVVEAINSLIGAFDFGPRDLTFSRHQTEAARFYARLSRRRGPVAPKYRAPDGSTWTGRGKMSKAIREAIEQGIPLESMLIE